MYIVNTGDFEATEDCHATEINMKDIFFRSNKNFMDKWHVDFASKEYTRHILVRERQNVLGLLIFLIGYV